MAKPKVLGVQFATKAASVRLEWQRITKEGTAKEQRLARAKLKSLATFETRARANPLTAGDPVGKDRWPRDLARDYGADIPNLFRFELADRWRGYYALVGEPGGALVWILYLWSHEEYDRQSGYEKK